MRQANFFAMNIEEGLLLTGETGGRQVFGGRRRSNGETDVLAYCLLRRRYATRISPLSHRGSPRPARSHELAWPAEPGPSRRSPQDHRAPRGAQRRRHSFEQVSVGVGGDRQSVRTRTPWVESFGTFSPREASCLPLRERPRYQSSKNRTYFDLLIVTCPFFSEIDTVANVLDICRPPSARYLQEQSSPTFHWRARAESHSGEQRELRPGELR